MPLLINRKANEEYLLEIKKKKEKYIKDQQEIYKKLKDDSIVSALNDMHTAEDTAAKKRRTDKEKKIALIGRKRDEKLGRVAIDVNTKISIPRAKIFVEKDDVTPDNKSVIFSFTKIEHSAVEEFRTKSKTFWGITVKKNSPEYEKLQGLLNRLNTDFGDGAFIGTDIESFKDKANDLRTLLEDIKEKSKNYIGKLKKTIVTESGRARKRQAEIILRMSTEKLKNLDDFIRLMEQKNTERNEKVEEEINNRINEINNKAIEDENTAIQKADLAEKEALGKIPEKENAIRNEKEKEYNNNINSIEDQVKEKFGDVAGFDNLDDTNKQLFIQAKIASSLFDEKHNPFADYRDAVKPGERSYDNIINLSKREDSVELNSLKKMFADTDPKMPLTYTADALLSISNLRVMDNLMGVEREKNSFMVDFVFEKDGTVLPGSVLKEKNAQDLAKEGFRCFVTGIKADPITSSNPYANNNVFKFDERGLVDKDVAYAILNFEDSILSEDVFGKDLLGGNPKVFFSSRIGQARSSIKDKLTVKEVGNAHISSNRQKYNFTSLKRLEKSIAKADIEYRPIRPSKKLQKKKYFKPGILENAGNYYDEDLISELGANNKTYTNKEIKFTSNVNRMIFDESSFKLNESSLTYEKNLKPLRILFDNLDKAEKNPKENSGVYFDSRLLEIRDGIRSMALLQKDDIFKYDEKKTGTGGELASSNFESEYDRKVGEVFEKISAYYNDYAKKDTSNKTRTAYASAINKWKNGLNIHGTKSFGKEIENNLALKKVDAVSDDTYLFNSAIFAAENEYFSIDNDDDKSKIKQYGLEKPNVKIISFKDRPLFTRKPSLSDFAQGKNGDCFFLSVIASKAGDNPQEIEDMMRDNGDGTVTCRFFNRLNEPVLVTVSKTLAVVGKSEDGPDADINPSVVTGEKGPLWFHLLEKAFVLSGIRESDAVASDENPDSFISAAKKKYNLDDKMDDEEVKKIIVAERYQDKYKVDFKELGFTKEQLDIIDAVPDNASKEDREKTERINQQKLEAKQKLDALENEYSAEFDKLLGQSLYAIDGGHMMHVMQNTTGVYVKRKELTEGAPDKILSDLSDIRNSYTKFTGTDIEHDYTDGQDRIKIAKIGRLAAQKLILDKVNWSVDLEGSEFKYVEQITLEELNDVIMDAVSNPDDPLYKSVFSGYTLNDDFTERVQKLGEELCSNITKHNMGNPGNFAIISGEPGKYSQTTLDTFDIMKKSLDNKKTVNCSFKGSSVKVFVRATKNSEPVLATRSEGLEQGGVLTTHAYSIIDYRKENGKVYLSVRNPWGSSGASSVTVKTGIGEKATEVSFDMFTEDDPQLYKEKDISKKMVSEGGVFEIELNDFMRMAEYIDYGEIDVPSRDKVSTALAGEAYKNIKKNAPQKLEAKIKGGQSKEVFIKKLSQSDRIQKSAEKLIISSQIQSLLDEGLKLPPEEIEQMKEYKKEILDNIRVKAPEKKMEKKIEIQAPSLGGKNNG